MQLFNDPDYTVSRVSNLVFAQYFVAFYTFVIGLYYGAFWLTVPAIAHTIIVLYYAKKVQEWKQHKRQKLLSSVLSHLPSELQDIHLDTTKEANNAK